MEQNINVLLLAYIGDLEYSLRVGIYLLDKVAKIDDMHKTSIKYVSAVNQAKICKILMDNNVFNEIELSIYNRARNHKAGHRSKTTDIITYKCATGFEAIIGHLYLNKDTNRIDEIMEEVFNVCIW